MKKFIALALAAIMLLSLSAMATAEKYGLGIVTTISGSNAGEKDGKGQVNSTICALVLDDEGKIVSVKFDVAQTNIAFNAKGEFTSDTAAVQKSKMEKKEEYGMKKASGLGKEWYEQAQALEAYCIGKTVEEVVSLETKLDEKSGHTKFVDADMLTIVTISVPEFLQALQKAADSAM